jgi:hypothetical protein
MNILYELYESLLLPIVETWEIAVMSVVYALIRAKHDSYLMHGKWKTYSFIEGCWIAVCVGFIEGQELVDYIMLPMIFAMWFTLFFDSFFGLFRVGKWWHFGSEGVDKKLKWVFRKPSNLFVFKLVWLIIINGLYASIKGWI